MANASLKNFKLKDFKNHSGDDSDSSEDEPQTKTEDDPKPFNLSHIVKTELTYNHDDDSEIEIRMKIG